MDDDVILLDVATTPREDQARARANAAGAVEGNYAINLVSVVTIASWFADEQPALRPLVDHTPGSRSAMLEAVNELLGTCQDADDVPLLALERFLRDWRPGFYGPLWTKGTRTP